MYAACADAAGGRVVHIAPDADFAFPLERGLAAINAADAHHLHHGSEQPDRSRDSARASSGDRGRGPARDSSSSTRRMRSSAAHVDRRSCSIAIRTSSSAARSRRRTASPALRVGALVAHPDDARAAAAASCRRTASTSRPSSRSGGAGRHGALSRLVRRSGARVEASCSTQLCERRGISPLAERGQLRARPLRRTRRRGRRRAASARHLRSRPIRRRLAARLHSHHRRHRRAHAAPASRRWRNPVRRARDRSQDDRDVDPA